MTETTASSATSGTGRPLYRDRDEGKFTGVCAAVARWTDTDPLLWRVLVIAFTIFSGVGLVLYAVGWLLIPEVDRPSPGQRLLHRDRPLSPLAVVAIIGGACLLALFNDDSDGIGALLVLAGIGYLVYRDRQGRPLAPAYVPPPLAAEAAPAVPVPRRRSRLGAVTLSATALLAGVLVLARTYGVDSLTPARILAVAVVGVGAGLVIGTWYGRSRWLAFVGAVLCLALAATAATDGRGILSGGLGHRTWAPAGVAATQSYRLGIGEATLDLTGLPAEGRHLTVTAKLGAGHLIVLVPDGVPIRLHASAGAGDITEFGRSIANGADSVDRIRSYGPAGDPRVEVEASVRTGQVEVRRG